MTYEHIFIIDMRNCGHCNLVLDLAGHCQDLQLD